MVVELMGGLWIHGKVDGVHRRAHAHRGLQHAVRQEEAEAAATLLLAVCQG